MSEITVNSNFDRDAYEIIRDQQPGLIKSIRFQLKAGKSPETIANRFRSKKGVVYSLVLCAAYYVKRNEGIGDQEIIETEDFEE